MSMSVTQHDVALRGTRTRLTSWFNVCGVIVALLFSSTPCCDVFAATPADTLRQPLSFDGHVHDHHDNAAHASVDPIPLEPCAVWSGLDHFLAPMAVAGLEFQDAPSVDGGYSSPIQAGTSVKQQGPVVFHPPRRIIPLYLLFQHLLIGHHLS